MLLVAISGWGLVAYSLANATEPVVFDHSNCQYPDRASNPPDGCDNTDPACPLEIKGGSCDNYVPPEAETAPWVPEEPTPPPVSQPTPIVTCK